MNNTFKKAVCILLSGALIIGLAGCGEEKNPKKPTSSAVSGDSSDESAVSNVSSDNSSADSAGNGTASGSDTQLSGTNSSSKTDDTYSHRAEYAVSTEGENEKFVDTDGQFSYQSVDWAGPQGYVIIIPAGNSTARESAQALQKYFAAKAGITLEIREDSAAKTAKEILIGKTNRSESAKTLEEAKLSVSVNNGKLVFDGGHDVTVDSAVQKFTRLPYAKGKANTFRVTTDFISTKFGSYRYVWGDEFEGDGLDLTKWLLSEWSMPSTDTIEVTFAKDIVDAQDGRLKLHTKYEFNPQREGSLYRVCPSVGTDESMNWLYGYVEIRARVPLMQPGAWPAFWACTDNGKNPNRASGRESFSIYPRGVGEVDIFEAYGSNWIQSNLHNHFDPHHCINDIDIWHSKSYRYFEDIENLPNEYHLYGLLWTPTEMKILVDGKDYITYDLTKNITVKDDVNGDWEFDMKIFSETPLNILFTNYVEESKIKASYGDMPLCFYIDYIRLYQKPGEGKLWLGKNSNTTYRDR